MLLASGVQYSPLLFAALAGWIMCTCLHEFSHALVAYWGGDRTVRDKGYLSVDPTRFIDPVFSLLIPAIVLLTGGFPFPGASVQIDTSRLKSDKWSAYVSAAGPISNGILFLLFALPLHPLLGLVPAVVEDRPAWVHYLGCMATLNFIAMLFNALPVPPLDGFGMIEHTLSHETRWKARQPGVTWMAFLGLMVVMNSVPQAMAVFWYMLIRVSHALGLSPKMLIDGYWFILFGDPPG